jgi:putative ABC transport system permease protein
LRKAIGATPSLIQNQFVVESMVLTGIGGIFGMIIGVSMAYLIAVVANQMGYNWDFIVTPASLIVSFSVSLCVGLVFGLYPARKAARLNPIEALRYE